MNHACTHSGYNSSILPTGIRSLPVLSYPNETMLRPSASSDLSIGSAKIHHAPRLCGGLGH